MQASQTSSSTLTTVDKSGNFEWTREHEKIFVREILVQEPFAHPKGSLARGKIWGSIADMLNDLKYPVFRVQKRSVKEKFNSLQQKYKSKMRKEKGASGIDVPPPTEVEQALEEITEKEEESILEENEKKEKSGQEKRKADDIRLKAMERMGETKKRKGEESENEETTRKKSRRSGSDTVNFLREKMAVESEARREEMQIKHQEQERWSAMFDQQHKMMQTMMQQQQQQSQMMMAFFQNTFKKT